jgi:hypothetical protein
MAGGMETDWNPEFTLSSQDKQFFIGNFGQMVRYLEKLLFD